MVNRSHNDLCSFHVLPPQQQSESYTIYNLDYYYLAAVMHGYSWRSIRVSDTRYDRERPDTRPIGVSGPYRN